MKHTAIPRAVWWLGATVLVACGAGSLEADFPPLAKKWFERATASYHEVDFEDAELSVDNALRIEPRREEIRVLAARVALANLNYDRTLAQLEGISTPGRGPSGAARSGIRARSSGPQTSSNSWSPTRE